MSQSISNISVFIDYDNLSEGQKRSGMLDVLTKALMQLSTIRFAARIACEVRVYGGWYEGSEMTQLAQDVSIKIGDEFPKLIIVSQSNGGKVAINTSAELAMALMQEPSYHLFGTYRKKGRPANVRVESQTDVGCCDDMCALPLMKRLLKNGKCPQLGCQITRSNLVYRNEQKIVDTMLSCDLIHAASLNETLVVLISSDDDFLPPLRTVLLRGVSAFRFHPQPNSQRASFPIGGARLIELEL